MADAEVVGRFLREARASLSLRSEHVARIHEVGTLEGPVGPHYMVMEQLDGADLRSIVQRGPLRLDDAVGYVLQACVALDEAHRLGIIHRDLKPENLFLTRRADGSPLVKVLDFGISKMPLAGTEMQLTSSATVMGTPNYMAPEQMRSMKLVTVRSDIWGMGAVLYELLSARRAFPGRSITEICTQVLMQSPPPLAEAPPELGAVVLRCLEKDPARRFASMAELSTALLPFARGASLPAHLAAAPQPPPAAHPAPTAAQPVPPAAQVAAPPAAPFAAPTAAPFAAQPAPFAAPFVPPLPGAPLLVPVAPARASSLVPWLAAAAFALLVVAALGVALIMRAR
jgi:serine/threonine-protein kinase